MPEPPPERLIGAYGDPAGPGPLVVAICGIHGNEPAGGVAARRVLAWLEAARPAFGGRFVALNGHLAALRLMQRGIDGDLNRRWSSARVAALREGTLRRRDAEDHEQAQLLGVLDAALAGARGPVLGLDLHSFSAPGPPFVVTRAAGPELAFAAELGVPVLVSLERFIGGTILELFSDEGLPILGFEAGRHDDPATVDAHAALIRLALAELGAVARESLPDEAADRALLTAVGRGLPRVVEVTHRHPLEPRDGFRMRPGFHNLVFVSRGEALADDRHGVVRAPRDGWLLMPLYQGAGEDGFFLAVERPLHG
ncbi:MAG: hypothetical protein CVU56_08415 [Deltaproteobacteria bacterium HGW-Deltaproteobacteria-14]|nr:MAG: hypothetical protein CVU56_08415 [Deltaproteobacteria bacterium HGW-Deltaproteobacteria-14]